MDFIESLLGGGSGDGISGLIRSVSRWVIGCGCMIVIAIVGGFVLLLAGIIKLNDDTVTYIMVFITMIVAVVSLIRSSLDR